MIFHVIPLELIKNARASLYDLTWRILSSLGYYEPVCSYVLHYLFRLFVLYLLVRVFVLDYSVDV